MTDVRWTAKLPLLIAGAVLTVSGLFVTHSKWRYGIICGALMIVLGGSFIAYSMTIKEWCRVVNPNSGFSSAFSMQFRGCLKQKHWLEL